MTHGSKNYREPGSIGMGTTPGRVLIQGIFLGTFYRHGTRHLMGTVTRKVFLSSRIAIQRTASRQIGVSPPTTRRQPCLAGRSRPPSVSCFLVNSPSMPCRKEPRQSPSFPATKKAAASEHGVFTPSLQQLGIFIPTQINKDFPYHLCVRCFYLPNSTIETA